MPVLPDILAPGLDVVFCGTAPGERSAARGHYFVEHGNRFWNFLHESGLTDELLAPEDDHRLPEFGVGLTDLVKDAAQSHDRGLDFSGTSELERRLLPVAPRWVTFAGITAGAQAAKSSVPCARVTVPRTGPWPVPVSSSSPIRAAPTPAACGTVGNARSTSGPNSPAGFAPSPDQARQPADSALRQTDWASRLRWISSWLSTAQAARSRTVFRRLRPSRVSSYSTRGGTSG
jgi:Uracil DNA glycosylase superfamily